MIPGDCFILIWMENVSINYKISSEKASAAAGLNLRIDAGEYVCISGLYGMDKISVINTIGCLDRPDSGKYLYDYNDTATISQGKLDSIRNSIGFLFRNLNLLEELTVYQNIELPLSISNKANKEQAISEAVQRLELTDLMNIQVKKLTDMQKHKVSLARALAVKPLLIIADEPADGLDRMAAEAVLRCIDEINKQGTAILCFTERKQLAERAKRQIIFENGMIKQDSSAFSNYKGEGAV